MALVRMTKITRDRLAEYATIPGQMSSRAIEVEDGLLVVEIDDHTAHRLRTIDDDLDKALVTLLDGLAAGQIFRVN